jgi:hypothetical protein
MLSIILVYSLQSAPFRCESDFSAAAYRDLQAQCSSLKGTLGAVDSGGCYKSGDDGGYVEYYSTSYSAPCEVGSTTPSTGLNLTTSQEGTRCEGLSELAEKDLKRQCDSVGGTVTATKIYSCETIDVGDYFGTYRVDAKATCELPAPACSGPDSRACCEIACGNG